MNIEEALDVAQKTVGSVRENIAGFSYDKKALLVLLDEVNRIRSAQSEPVAYLRMRGGSIDWVEDCLSPDNDLGGYESEDDYSMIALYTAPPDRASIETENYELRLLLANYACGSLLYADDGELQDNSKHPCIDFKRDSPKIIAATQAEQPAPAISDSARINGHTPNCASNIFLASYPPQSRPCDYGAMEPAPADAKDSERISDLLSRIPLATFCDLYGVESKETSPRNLSTWAISVIDAAILDAKDKP